MNIPGRAMFSRYGSVWGVDTSAIRVPPCLCTVQGVEPRRIHSWFKVYLLIDPRSGGVRYVGQTQDAVARIRSHSSAVTKPSARRDWVESLRAEGLPPVMFVVGVGTIPEESVALAHVLAAGADALNAGAELKRARAICVGAAETAEVRCFLAALASVDWVGEIRAVRPVSWQRDSLEAMDARLAELAFYDTARRDIHAYRRQNV